MVFSRNKNPELDPVAPDVEKQPEGMLEGTVEGPLGPDTPEGPESSTDDVPEGPEGGLDDAETPDDPVPEPDDGYIDPEPEIADEDLGFVDEPEDGPETEFGPVREIPAMATLQSFAGKASQAKHVSEIDVAFADLMAVDPSRDEFIEAMTGINVTPGMLWTALKAHH